MRLIDVNTLEFEEFIGSEILKYAILSHTWHGDTEVIFQEWERAATDASIRQKAGYAKIVGACRLARADGWQYLWCDTNCIDKTSSAELSEAINSMYAWYRDSQVCYAYLNDVQANTDTLSKSRWFRRGWTLQELLAPSVVRFYDHNWTPIGTKMELASTISDITKIHISALEDPSTIHAYSIAQRMSWAADRETTRPEDIAYCLLGIFDINMPLLYGEGQNAFTRLQREIIKVSADQSILAWDLQSPHDVSLMSVLAPSPAEFRFCGSIVRSEEIQTYPYSTTNIGLSMKLTLMETSVERIVLVGLNCAKELRRTGPQSVLLNGIRLHRHFPVWIPLRRGESDIYSRADYPLSKIFLHQSYSMLGYPTTTDMFLSLDEAQIRFPRSFSNPTHTLLRQPTQSSSGVLISVASGIMSPYKRILKEVYPLREVSILQLKHRGVSTVSHQLISCGNISIIFSVFWDGNGSPREWLDTAIIDPELEGSSRIASQPEWSGLFEATDQSQPSRSCDSPAAMHLLHKRLQQANKKPLSVHAKEENHPIVNVETQPLEDLFGQPELVVNIIFQETSRFRFSAHT